MGHGVAVQQHELPSGKVVVVATTRAAIAPDVVEKYKRLRGRNDSVTWNGNCFIMVTSVEEQQQQQSSRGCPGYQCTMCATTIL